MNNPASFTVTATSRHPRINLEYDTEQHRYRDHHLNPSWGILEMDAFPGVESIVLGPGVGKPLPHKPSTPPQGPFDPTDPTQDLPEAPMVDDDIDPIDIEVVQLKIPEDTVAYDWTIRQVNGDFQARESKQVQKKQGRPVGDGKPYEWSIRVPEPGAYRIELTLRRELGSESTHSETFQMRNFFVVSIGDSYAAGEGNPDHPGKIKEIDVDIDWWEAVALPWIGLPAFLVFEAAKAVLRDELLKESPTLQKLIKWDVAMDPKPVWLEAEANRSLRSGPAMAAKLLEDTETGDLVTFVTYARSGAEIQDGLFGPRTSDGKPIDQWIGNIGELDELRRDLQRMRSQVGERPVDALLMIIGGNDTGFSSRLTDLVKLDILNWGDDQIEVVQEKVQKALNNLRDDFEKLAEAIASLNVRQVYITEYPTAHFERTLDDGRVDVAKGCGIFEGPDLDIEEPDAELMKSAAEQLNDLIRDEATNRGWVYVDGIAEEFRGRGYCMGEESYFRSAEGSLALQGDTNGTMHPKETGHRVYAERIKSALKKHMIDGQPVEPASGKNLSLLRALERQNITTWPCASRAIGRAVL